MTASPDFFTLYMDLDAWQLHVRQPYNDRAYPWSGTNHSSIVATFRSEGAIRAALEALPARMLAWGYNPKRHGHIPGRLLAEHARLKGQLPHAGIAAYCYATSGNWGNRPWHTVVQRDNERLEISVAIGPRTINPNRNHDQACVLVTLWHETPDGTRSATRLWLDDFFNARGALARSRFAKEHPHLDAAFLRLRGRADAATLLGQLADGFGDMAVHVRKLNFAHSRYVADDRHTYSNAARALLDGFAPAPAAGPDLLARLAREFPCIANEHLLAGSAVHCGWPEQLLTAPCAAGCDGTFAQFESYLNSSWVAPYADIIAELLADASRLGYRCTCRLVAGEALLAITDYSEPYEDPFAQGVVQAVQAGLAADN